MPTLQVLVRAWDHVADVDQLAGFGVRHQGRASLPVLQIEHFGKCKSSATQRRMVDRRRDFIAADPNFAIIDKPAQKLFAGASWHPFLPTFVFHTSRAKNSRRLIASPQGSGRSVEPAEVSTLAGRRI